MSELRCVDPNDPLLSVRLKLTQSALGIVDLYVDGYWLRRTTWSPVAGFADMPFHNGVCCELAMRFADMVNARNRRGSR